MAHMKVYENYKAKLVKVLPMNDVIFTTQLSSNKILPGNVEAHIKSLSLPTQPDKADYYLNKVIKSSLDIGETGSEDLETLIAVMEKSEYRYLEKLAKAMKSDLDKELKGEYIAINKRLLIANHSKNQCLFEIVATDISTNSSYSVMIRF